MSLFTYTAAELYSWITGKEDIVVIDVRNTIDFGKFHLESPFPFEMHNIPYFDFIEDEDGSVARVPQGSRIRIVCAKESSARFVAEIFDRHGFTDVGYLEGGIKSWGNLLVPVRLNPGAGFSLYQFIRPGKASCSYGLIYKDELMLFDPSRNVRFYLDFAAAHGCRLVATFETHLQADYIAGSRLLAAATGARFYANASDFAHAKLSYSALQDGGIHSFSQAGGPTVKVLFTPGHTPGSTSFIVNEQYLISGDSIFIHSIGRPDLGGKVDEWSVALFRTLKMMWALDDGMIVLPAHFMSWDEADGNLTFTATLARTREYNSDIHAITDSAAFLAFIKANMRKQPDEYAAIRRINANLEEVDDERAEELDLGKNECAAEAHAASKAGN
ncbi:MBL fold metallo-hydrolase [Desulfoprunum benzoelyticum]|uniref:Glyoxylase-like metal-dependent hydrolase (Beta-lactamase superfamily II) n=1 Tax=Desulfoprunum benzoelyticum TaxID=1506996 RepID=A0A840V1T3_9BACT|nr:MBL fold metallo-hydrolase [Desulfoprunum benzoelyticum]MBB5348808.1 glyoxylase-like metal-dependent hydrolase (beta-lactamase superfamily II) [Desulfoprunum benzoelyticum]MBM9529971.1 MBL fold metallo-hydrolase [Desulfoprunum benzoelyticum]